MKKTRLAAVSSYSGDVLPPACLEYEFDRWTTLTYCTFDCSPLVLHLVCCSPDNGIVHLCLPDVCFTEPSGKAPLKAVWKKAETFRIHLAGDRRNLLFIGSTVGERYQGYKVISIYHLLSLR